MDPNTTPTPNPMPNPAPAPNPTPVAPTAPVAPAPEPTAEPAAPAPAAPAFDTSVFESATTTPISATDPITQPEPAPAPDPVEEALKAPMKPADPVPGSIGSAVSMGTEPAGTPNVSFNDPAAEQPMMQPTQDMPVTSKKKSNTGLIILCIIAIVVVAALGVVLAMQLLGNSGTSNNNTSVTPEVKPEPTPSTISNLECKYVLTDEELTNFGAASGTSNIVASYDGDSLTSLSFSASLAYLDLDSAASGLESMENSYTQQYKDLGLTEDPFNAISSNEDGNVKFSYQATADLLDATNIQLFGLTTADGATLDTSSAAIKAGYESLDFSCDSL